MMEQPDCGKCVYESRNDARKAAGKQGGSRVYRCQDCGYWHLTTARQTNHKKFRQHSRNQITFAEIEMMRIALEEIQDRLAVCEPDQDFGHTINLPPELAREIKTLVKRIGPKIDRIVRENRKREMDGAGHWPGARRDRSC